MYRNCHVLKATYPKNRYGADADGGAYWRHLVNTIEPSVCGSDVKLLFTVTVACCLVLFRSDADPDVLAKYVMALVKKDKPVNELISTCQAQLDIFLQKSKHISFCYHVCVMTDVHFCSVVTVSKCFLSVGFGRFCRKKPRFSVRFRFS